MIPTSAVDPGMDAAALPLRSTFRQTSTANVLANRSPAIQLNVDATRMSQPFTGSGNIQEIVLGEVDEFVRRHRGSPPPAVDFALRAWFNPNLDRSWLGVVNGRSSTG